MLICLKHSLPIMWITERSVMSRISLLFVVLAMGAPWAAAQTSDPATKELIEKLLARIDGLEKRVASTLR